MPQSFAGRPRGQRSQQPVANVRCMAFDILFVFGLYIAPPLILIAAIGLLTLAASPRLNAAHAKTRRRLWIVLVVASTAAVLLGVLVRAYTD